MFRFIFTILALALTLNTTGLAAKKNHKPTNPAQTEVQAANPQPEFSDDDDSNPMKTSVGNTHFSISAPMALIESEVFWGGNLSIYHRVTPNVSLGGETGFHTWSKSQAGVSANVWVIPILPTILYHFDVTSETFQPFIGLGLGVGIAHANVKLGDLSGSATQANFEGLAHIGSNFGSDQSFFMDIKLGILNSSFVFIPALGWQF